jgi:hypothetical protein
MDYSYDQTKRMYIHKGEVNTLDTAQVKAFPSHRVMFL